MAFSTAYLYKRVTCLTKVYWVSKVLNTVSAHSLIECGGVCSSLYNSNTGLAAQQCYAFSYDKITKKCEVAANPQQIETVSDVNEQQIFFLMDEMYSGRHAIIGIFIRIIFDWIFWIEL
jgi:hypothetical protein